MLLCHDVRFVTFDTNLNLLKTNVLPHLDSEITSLIFLIPILIAGNPSEFFEFLLCQTNYPIAIMHWLLSFTKRNHSSLSHVLYQVVGKCFLPYLGWHLYNPTTFQIAIFILKSIMTIPSYLTNSTIWIPFLLIILSSDVEFNPGPVSINDGFSFAQWNINSLAKDDFSRAKLLQAHNSIFNYDIISLCEISLNDQMEIPNPLMEGYNFEPLNHPSGNKRGGVGIFYKETLPLKVRRDLSFDECLVSEIHIGKKKIFHSVIYRSPSVKAGCVEFDNFLTKFENLRNTICAEEPYASFFVGDFNAHSQNWWPDGDTNEEGQQIDDLTSSLSLHQLIMEPTNFEPNKIPSCIDLIFTDQPNIVMESGVRPSLDNLCHHQITFCKLNLHIPPPPAYFRKLWHFSRANSTLIRQSISQFNWETSLANQNPSCQVALFNKTLLNIMSNFIPNEYLKVQSKDPPWIGNNLRRLLKKQNRQYKAYVRKGCRTEDKIRVDKFREECFEATENAKNKYLREMGKKLVDNQSSSKTYWKILSKLINKANVPRIPPILYNNKFVVNCKEKACLFNEYFLEQCKPIANNSVLPDYINYKTESKLTTIIFSNDDILSMIRAMNPNKSHGFDNISIRMIQLCGESIITPLTIIFNSIVDTGVYPDGWKCANVTPIHKKDHKQVLSNYRPISLLPVCAKLFEKILFKNIYNHLTKNNLITNNQSGFRPGDSTTNQLLFLVHSIHKAFDHKDSRQVRAVFLDISKAFDKVWHSGLIFKLKQNGIDGKLLSLMASYLMDRKQRVVINGFSSEWGSIEAGVPQGSVLGPLLFLVYINDLEEGIKSQVKFFADDTSLFSIITDPKVSASELNHDLALIESWARQWKMSFNPDPTKQAVELIFSKKKKF